MSRSLPGFFAFALYMLQASCTLLDSSTPQVGPDDILFEVQPNIVTATRIAYTEAVFTLNARYENAADVSVFLLGEASWIYFDLERLNQDSLWHPSGILWAAHPGDEPLRTEVRPGESLPMEWSINTRVLPVANGATFGEGTLEGTYRMRVWPSLQKDGGGSDRIPESGHISGRFTFDESPLSWN